MYLCIISKNRKVMSRTYKHEQTGSKARFHSCRNHGTCPWCTRRRTYRTMREIIRCQQQINELLYIDYL